MIPGDLLSAFPHRQFHTLPGLLDSWAALPNSYPNALRAMQGGSLYHFYDGLWYDPAERRTHDLPCERRTRYHWANPTRYIYIDKILRYFTNMFHNWLICDMKGKMPVFVWLFLVWSILFPVTIHVQGNFPTTNYNQKRDETKITRHIITLRYSSRSAGRRCWQYNRKALAVFFTVSCLTGLIVLLLLLAPPGELRLNPSAADV